MRSSWSLWVRVVIHLVHFCNLKFPYVRSGICRNNIFCFPSFTYHIILNKVKDLVQNYILYKVYLCPQVSVCVSTRPRCPREPWKKRARAPRPRPRISRFSLSPSNWAPYLRWMRWIWKHFVSRTTSSIRWVMECRDTHELRDREQVYWRRVCKGIGL